MPWKTTLENAEKDKRRGKAPTTQAGEFVHEEIEHVRRGKHGARSAKQAIAIGLSKARRAGVKLPPPKPGTTSERTRRQAARDERKGEAQPRRKPSPRRSRARGPPRPTACGTRWSPRCRTTPRAAAPPPPRRTPPCCSG